MENLTETKKYQEKLLIRTFGNLPENWQVLSMDEVFSQRTEFSADLEKYPLFSFTIANNVTPKTERYERSFLLKNQEENEFKLVYPNDFVINPMNLRFGAVGYSRVDKVVCVSAYYDTLKLINSKADIDFIEAFLNSKQMLEIFDRVATGSLIEKRRVHYSEFKNLKIFFPPEKEQKRIGNILRIWSKSIEVTEKLICTKKKLKKSLMQRLLTGSQRFPEFHGREWKEVKLKDVFERVTRKNVEVNTNVVTISAQRGFVRQSDYFNKNVASEILDNYFLVEKGEFCYNKSYSNGYPWGATKRLNDFDKAVVTTLYICFGIKNEKETSGNFFEQFFESNLMEQGLAKVAHEGGRAHGLLNVTPSDFFNLKITIPAIEEQKKIAAVLNASDAEINVLQNELAALRQQKRGLMQKLLTGRVRVKTEPEVEEIKKEYAI